jgi:hypothetical protein
MEAITLEPEVLDRIFRSLPPEDRVEILSIGAAFRRLSLEKQLVRARSKVQEFEAKYHTTLRQLEAEGLPDDADYAMHEDYIEWHYWPRVLEQTRKTLDALAAISPAPEPVQ